MYLTICAKCSRQSAPLNSTHQQPKDWRALYVSDSPYFTQDYTVALHFCPRCADEMKIPEQVKRSLTPAEQLVDILETLIAEEVEIQISNSG